MIEDKSTSASTTKQLSKIKTFISIKSKKKHCVFFFVFTFIFFKIFLFRNRRAMIVDKSFSSSSIFKDKSSRILSKDCHDMFTQRRFARTYSKHFALLLLFFIATQRRSKAKQRSQEKTTKTSYQFISTAMRRWLSSKGIVEKKSFETKTSKRGGSVTCSRVRTKI